MPTQLPINLEVLNQARKIHNRKTALAMEGTGMVPKPKIKDAKGNIVNAPFDARHPTDIACLLIDTKGIPDEQLDEYFIEETKKIALAFYTIDEKTKKPDPEVIKPYIQAVYNKMTCFLNTDWNSVEDVETILAAKQASQSFATFVKDFPNVVLDLYPNIEDVRRIDDLTGKASFVFHDLNVFMNQHPDPSKAVNEKKAKFSSQVSLIDRLESELGHPVFDARMENSNTVHLDALATDLTMKHFLNMDIYAEFGEFTHDTDDYSRAYLETLAKTYKKTSVEQMPDNAIAASREEMSIHYDRLFINGKSISQIMLDIKDKRGCSMYDAEAIAGKMFTKALTDGKSIVTMLQISPAKEGKADIRHQEIKVDLDALNKADRENTKYSRFRRILDYFGIWKIQKFKSNEARDAAQAEMRKSTSFQNALREAEEKYINEYSGAAVQNHLARSNPDMAKAFPQLVKVETVEKEKSTAIDLERIPITGIKNDIENVVEVQPKCDDVDKTISKETKII